MGRTMLMVLGANEAPNTIYHACTAFGEKAL